MNFIILHGTLGTPDINWFPWLSEQLEKRGHRTFRPQLSTPEGQSLKNWVATIKNTVDSLGVSNNQIVLVAHSMSPYAVCHYLTTIQQPVGACLFVAGFSERLPDPEEPYPSLNNPLLDVPVDWELVRKNSKQFICFSSDNDPYVPVDIAMRFAQHLRATQIVVPSAEHFSTLTFPLLLSTIERVLL